MSNSSNQPQLYENLGGSLDIMLGRSSGLARIDTSANGFIQSFWGLALTALIDATSLSITYSARNYHLQEAYPGKPGFIIGMIFVAGLAYLASMLMLYLFCRTPDLQSRFFNSVIAHNWASPIVSLGVTPLLFFDLALPGSGVTTPLSILVLGLLIVAAIRLIRIPLEITFGNALMFFVATTAVSLVCSQGLKSLFGLPT